MGVTMKKSFCKNGIVKLTGMVCTAVLLMPLAGYAGTDKFVDSDDYKDKEFKKCIISDYTHLTEGDDVNWVWVADGVKTSQYKLSMGNVQNVASNKRTSDTDAVKTEFTNVINDTDSKDKNEKVTADICIFEVQKFSYGKVWIPFVGGHQAQAGVGVEVVLKDKNKNTVAEFRHFTREGARTEEAAQEAAEDIVNYLSKN
jgi:hypothetical protein